MEDRAPQLDVIKENFEGIRVDTIREIIANKLTPLISRSELKDVVALYFLKQAGYNLLDSVPDAQRKDGRWEPAVVSMLLDGLLISEMPSWLLRALSQSDIQAFLTQFRLAFAEKAFPNG